MRIFQRRFRALRDVHEQDAGISIIEVLTATMVFLIISVGIAQSLVTSVRLSGDQKHRVTALSLAASAIDTARALKDPFNVQDDVQTKVIDNIAYTVTRDTAWVSGSGSDLPCGGSGTANLQLKRVNVSVTWKGRLTTSPLVTSDTVIAPVGRINDPTLGTIVISAKGADGSGTANVVPVVTPVSGGAVALTTAPPATDVDGCSYALQVKPGTYRVTLSTPNYVSIDQTAAPYMELAVIAGQTANFPFTYDKAGTFNLGALPPGAILPSGATVTLWNSYGVYPFADGARAKSLSVFPFGLGYFAVAGAYVAPTQASAGCRSVDPSEWPAGPSATGIALLAGDHGNRVSASATTVPVPTLNIRYGVAQLALAATAKIVATNVAPPGGSADPGCGATQTYTFNSVAAGTAQLALPFGTWKLTATKTSNGAAMTIASVTPSSNADPAVVSGSTVTLDPRAKA